MDSAVEVAMVMRPQTRAQCLEEARPCPWVSCRHHLLLEAGPSLRLNVHQRRVGRAQVLRADAAWLVVRSWIDDAIEQLARMPHTCALDVVDEQPDGVYATDIARMFDVSKQLIDRQVRDLVHREDVRAALALHTEGQRD